MKLQLKVVDKQTNKIYEVKAIDFLHECVYISTDENENWQDKLENYKILLNTGLQDKNGKEIYEGDILSLFENRYKMHVKFNKVLAQFEPRQMVHADDTEIIGNVFENPELLEVAR